MIPNKYPSIETVFPRDKSTNKLSYDRLRDKTHEAVAFWIATEKVDGTNIRVSIERDGSISYYGRNTNIIPPGMKEVLDAVFLPAKEAILAAYPDESMIVIYGEGFGQGIRGSDTQEYTKSGKHFIMFDVYLQYDKGNGYFLDVEELKEFSKKFNIEIVPIVGVFQWNDIGDNVLAFMNRICPESLVAKRLGGNQAVREGIVCKPLRELRDRYGNRIMWKLTFREFK